MKGFGMRGRGWREPNPKNLCQSVAKKYSFVQFVEFVAKKPSRSSRPSRFRSFVLFVVFVDQKSIREYKTTNLQ